MRRSFGESQCVGSAPAAAALSEGGIIDAALRAGLLEASDVVWRTVIVQNIGRSHAVYRVSVDDEPRAIVKVFEPSRGDTDGDPAREHAVARLSLERPEVAALHAPILDWPGDDRVVATAFVDGRSAWSPEATGHPSQARWRDLVATLVPPVAEFHRATRDLARNGATMASLVPVRPIPPEDVSAIDAPFAWPSGPPWALRLFSGDAPREVWASQPLATLLRGVARDTRAVGALWEARTRWRPLCLVHGDLKHDNVLVRTDTAQNRIVLLDWEMARVGDPAWDLAGLAVPLPMTSSDEVWDEATLDGVGALVQAYGAASGLAVPALARRLALYTGAWLLMSAVQHRCMLPADLTETPADAIAERAQHALISVDRITLDIVDRVGRP